MFLNKEEARNMYLKPEKRNFVRKKERVVKI